MRYKTRLALWLSALVAVLLAACAPTAPAAAPAEDDAAASDQVYEVVFWEHGPWTRAPLPSPEDDFIRAYIRENYNLDIEIQAAPTDGADAKLNAMVAAGELPDFIEAYWTVGSVIAQQYIDQGVLIPIDQYLDDTPYLQSFLDEDAWTYMTLNGQKYALAQPRPLDNWDTVWIRQDWLDKLGLEMPTTVDELAAVAEAFTFQDPDGNGQDDTYGFTATISEEAPFGSLRAIFAPFGAWPGNNHIRIVDNQVVFDAFSPEARAALEWWHAQVEAGVVDPDWTANKTDNWRDIVSQGKVGIVNAEFQFLRHCGSASCLGEIIEAASPEAVWVQVPALEGPFGTYAAWAGEPVDVRFWFTREAESEPGKMEAIMRFFNDAMNPDSELYKIMVYGQEGVHYKTDETGRRIERIIPEGMDWMSYYVVMRRGDEGYFWYYKMEPNELWEKQQFSTSQPKIEHVTPLIVSHEAWPDLRAYMQEMHVRFAIGEEPLENWDQFVQEAMTTYGGETVIADATEQLKTLGLIK